MISMLVITAHMCWGRVGQGRAANIDTESPVSVTADMGQEPMRSHRANTGDKAGCDELIPQKKLDFDLSSINFFYSLLLSREQKVNDINGLFSEHVETWMS